MAVHPYLAIVSKCIPQVLERGGKSFDERPVFMRIGDEESLCGQWSERHRAHP
jgi:hypothetical protein